jgi:hypothetical protein
MQNVTMTIDYCFQALRVRPGGAIAINSEDPPPPFVAFEPVIPSGFPAAIINEYPAQLALLAYPPPASQDHRSNALLCAFASCLCFSLR